MTITRGFIDDSLTSRDNTRELMLVMSSVSRIDFTALQMLIKLDQDLAARGARLHFAELKGPVTDRLHQSDLLAALSGQVFLSTYQAYQALSPASLNPHQS